MVNQVLSISRSWSLGFWNCILILSSVLVLTWSWSPRGYQCADTSRTSSKTRPRSSKVSLFPERSRKDHTGELCDYSGCQYPTHLCPHYVGEYTHQQALGSSLCLHSSAAVEISPHPTPPSKTKWEQSQLEVVGWKMSWEELSHQRWERSEGKNLEK